VILKFINSSTNFWWS